MSKENNELVIFNPLKADIAELVAPTLLVKVTDFKTSQMAIDIAKQVRDYTKKVDTTRKALVEPLNSRVKSINEYARNITQPLLEAESHLKLQLIAFEKEQDRIRQEEFRKAAEEQKKKEAELAAKQEADRVNLEASMAHETAAVAIFGEDEESAPVESKVEAFHEKQLQEQAILRAQGKLREYDIKQQGIKNAAKIWKCEAEDLSKVPREFLVITLNEKAVLAAARAGVPGIPGVRIWQETTLRIGTKTYVPRAALIEEESTE